MPAPIHFMRYAAGQPARRIPAPASFASAGQLFADGQPLPGHNGLRILVWNIFKQQRPDCLPLLERFARHTQLMLLQEAQTTPALISFATRHYKTADQVPALGFTPHPSGVMTLSLADPLYCCPLCQPEPILRLAKSSLITVYPLANSLLLMVINIHAINFTLGTDMYRKQLHPIGEQIACHQGPVIMAGDFNAWSDSRINTLYRFARAMRLREVRFPYDQRRRAFGRPLDFVFYRQLKVHQADVLVTQASDHNPLLVEFFLPAAHSVLG